MKEGGRKEETPSPLMTIKIRKDMIYKTCIAGHGHVGERKLGHCFSRDAYINIKYFFGLLVSPSAPHPPGVSRDYEALARVILVFLLINNQLLSLKPAF